MKKVKLNNIAIFVLFITSYIPLFGLLILRQVKQNIDFLNFGGFNQESIFLAIKKFGVSGFLFLLAIFGFIGLKFLLTNLDKKRPNGELVKIVEVENKNSETISYISTYIVPFIFQDTNNLFDISSIFIVLIIIFFIYTKSNMIVINPILSISPVSYTHLDVYKRQDLEKKRVNATHPRLVNKVLLLGKQRGLGYDISSVEADENREEPEFARFVEVKSTKRITEPDLGDNSWTDTINLTRKEWIAAKQYLSLIHI